MGVACIPFKQVLQFYSFTVLQFYSFTVFHIFVFSDDENEEQGTTEDDEGIEQVTTFTYNKLDRYINIKIKTYLLNCPVLNQIEIKNILGCIDLQL